MAETGEKLNIFNLPEDRPFVAATENPHVRMKVTVNDLDPKSRIGYHLARIVLGMISIFLIFLIIYIFLNLPSRHSQIDYKTLVNLPDSVLLKKLADIKAIQTENKESRDFVIQISQMVLLNMLLPILTAILGYIFGSHSEAKG
ncbi:MAG: hypothetical protein EOP42_17465 [Sphingobacteriaceae bacterium]|nr:MAG: hypothetical protein EOP42_17465 [Sphingobacteriaceae bacterium]